MFVLGELRNVATRPSVAELASSGGPGSGKGTQCELLRAEFGPQLASRGGHLEFISVGGLLRDELKRHETVARKPPFVHLSATHFTS